MTTRSLRVLGRSNTRSRSLRTSNRGPKVFLTFVVSKTLGPRFEVRSERLRVFERPNTRKERVVIPDIVVRDRQDQRVVLVVDAKYETAFPVVGAGDFY